MRAFIKKLIKQALPYTEAVHKLLSCYSLRFYLEEIGWFRSVVERLPVDRDGNSLPWFTYPAIFFLSSKIKPEMVVFEYGSGNSTLWWGKQVSSVTSYEHDLEWYNSLRGRIPSNVEYLHCELIYGGEYSKAILRYVNRFDIVVIDGRDRVNCAKNSLGALRDNGVIVWDNSDRGKYEEGYSYLILHGFRRLDFKGNGPINVDGWITSIFYRDNNCFGI